MSSDAPEKVGAGFLFFYQDELGSVGRQAGRWQLLLLKRSDTSGNPGTWGVPGGNVDPGENLWQAAVRECREEIGVAPPSVPIRGSILTKRGKNLQKHFTLFVAVLPLHEKAQLDSNMRLDRNEHVDSGWFILDDLLVNHAQGRPPGFALHPVPHIALLQSGAQLRAMLEPKTDDDF